MKHPSPESRRASEEWRRAQEDCATRRESCARRRGTPPNDDHQAGLKKKNVSQK
jgi:hypothetical protein